MRKERWRIEVTKVTGDSALLASVLKENGFELNSGLLLSDQFEMLSDASEVYATGSALCQEINRISDMHPDINMTFRLGSVQELTKGGVKRVHMAAGVAGAAALAVSGRAVLSNASVTDEERAEMERQKRIERASVILRAVRTDKDVLIVMQLLNGEPTPTELGHVVDIIRDNMNGDMSAWATKNKLKRFKRSINHQAVFGLDARHARSKDEPPPNPMHMAEAIIFVRDIADQWVTYIGGRK